MTISINYCAYLSAPAEILYEVISEKTVVSMLKHITIFVLHAFVLHHHHSFHLSALTDIGRS